jgi:transposase
MARLSKEQVVTICVLNEKGESHCATARVLGVTEGAVRYHLRRKAAGSTDGRSKAPQVERAGLAAAVAEWWRAQTEGLPAERPPNVRLLYEWLRSEHGYAGSYKSVRKYARQKFAGPKRRPFRRVETPPGAQSQTDWAEFAAVDVGDAEGATKLYALVMTLSHSRKEAVVWSRSMDQLAWHRCHNEAFRRLGGVAAINRIDNLKTGIATGAGAWGEINGQYRTYARTLGFHVDACEPNAPQQKGKVERRVGVFQSLHVTDRPFEGLEDLQAKTDAPLEARSHQRICPATGKSVHESWEAEKPLLRPLPEVLPEPFDLVRSCRVYKDCSVRFEGRTYIVPFRYWDKEVEIRGCSGVVQVLDPRTGGVVVSYPRHTAERILIDPACYDGPATDQVQRPAPLGRMGRRLMEIAALPVQRRPIDLYAALAEAAR